MRKQLGIAIAAGALLAAMLPGVTSAATVPAPFLNADIDNNGDCDVRGETFDFGIEDPGSVNVAINKNWIIGTCHMDLEPSDVGSLGGPFERAQVYRGFTCYVGIEEEVDDASPDSLSWMTDDSHATVSPSGRMNIYCKASMKTTPEHG